MRVPKPKEVTVMTFRGMVCAGVGGVVVLALALSLGAGAFGQSKPGPVDPGVRRGPSGAGGR
jgi:hypothetical protein